MAVRQTQSLVKFSYGVGKIHFSTSTSINNKWRLKNGLEPNPMRYGPLNLLPDFSYVDGRPTPLSFNKIQKVEYQQKLCQRIVELNNELDVGLERYYEREKMKKEAKAAKIQNKLKPKGVALLKKKKKEDLE